MAEITDSFEAPEETNRRLDPERVPLEDQIKLRLEVELIVPRNGKISAAEMLDTLEQLIDDTVDEGGLEQFEEVISYSVGRYEDKGE